MVEAENYQIDKRYKEGFDIWTVKRHPDLLIKPVTRKELELSLKAGEKGEIGPKIESYSKDEKTNEYLMVMEKIEGRLFSELTKKELKEQENNLLNTIQNLIYNYNIYTDDIHKDNIIIQDNNKIRIIDYGGADAKFVNRTDNLDNLVNCMMSKIYGNQKYKCINPNQQIKDIESLKIQKRIEERLKKINKSKKKL